MTPATVLDHLKAGGLLYNGSITLLWLYVCWELTRRWSRIETTARVAIVAWWVVGLVLVAARFGAGLPASGHAIWMWPLLVLTVRLELPSWSRWAALAVVALVIVFKFRFGNVESLVLGSAIGVPVALLAWRLEPYGSD